MDKTGYFLGLYEKSMPNSLSLREKLIETKKAGFDYMEISIDETDEKLERLKWSSKKKQELVRAHLGYRHANYQHVPERTQEISPRM